MAKKTKKDYLTEEEYNARRLRSAAATGKDGSTYTTGGKATTSYEDYKNYVNSQENEEYWEEHSGTYEPGYGSDPAKAARKNETDARLSTRSRLHSNNPRSKYSGDSDFTHSVRAKKAQEAQEKLEKKRESKDTKFGIKFNDRTDEGFRNSKGQTFGEWLTEIKETGNTPEGLEPLRSDEEVYSIQVNRLVNNVSDWLELDYSERNNVASNYALYSREIQRQLDQSQKFISKYKNDDKLRAAFEDTSKVLMSLQNSLNYAANTREATLKDMTVGSIKQGYYQKRLGEELNKQMMGEENEVEKYAKLLASDEFNYDSRSWLKRGIVGGGNLAGQIGGTVVDPNTWALVATDAAVGGGIGSAVPGIGTIGGTIAGAGAGFVQSATLNAYEIESGFAYQELLDNGIDPALAKKIAVSIGVANAGLEMVQADTLVDAFKVVKKAGAETVAGKIAQELSRRGLDVGKETAQEVAQEATTIIGAQAASKIQNDKWQYTSDEVKDRLKETAVSSALGFGVLNAPAGAVNTGRTISRNNQNLDLVGAIVKSRDAAEVVNRTEERIRQEEPQMGDIDRAVTSMAVAKKINGETLTAAEEYHISKSPVAQRILEESATGTLQAGNNVNKLIDDASKSKDEKTVKLAKNLKSKLETGQRLSDREVGKLYTYVNKTNVGSATKSATRSATKSAAKTETPIETKTNIERQAESKVDVSEARTQVIVPDSLGSNKTATLKSISIEDDGTYVELDNGEKVLADDVNLNKGVKQIIDDFAHYDTELANQAVMSYVEAPQETKEIQSPTTFSRQFSLAVEYSRLGRPMEFAVKSGTINTLSETQLQTAYSIGQRLSSVSAKQKFIDDSRVLGQRRTGSFSMEKVNLNRVKRTLSKQGYDNLKKEIRLITALTQTTGLNIVLEESTANNQGQFMGANGWMDKDGTIHLDINALRDTTSDETSMMLYTLSHELTHLAKVYSPQMWKEYSDFMIRVMEENGESLESLIQAKKEEYASMGQTLTNDQALEEIVAQGSQMCLTNSGLLERMAWENMTMFQKFKEWLLGIIEDIKRTYRTYDKNLGREADAVIDRLDEVAARFETLQLDAIQALNELPAELSAKALESVKDIDGESLFQHKTMTQDVNGYMDDLLENSTFSKDKKINETVTDHLRDTINIVMKKIDEHLDILDYNHDMDGTNRPFSPVKMNSDPHYKAALDFSTLCRKRILQQTVIERLQEKLGTALTAKEQTLIREELKKMQKQYQDIQVACALCYVEAARLATPQYVNQFFDKGVKKKKGEMSTRYKALLEYYALDSEWIKKERKRISREMFGVEKITKSEIKSQYGKEALDEFYQRTVNVREGYEKYLNEHYNDEKLPAEERERLQHQKEMLDKIETIPQETFLTADGLAELALKDRDIYNAFITYVRERARSKALESRVPYVRGDIANTRKITKKGTLGGRVISESQLYRLNQESGFRFSAWSDFEARHILDLIGAIIDCSTAVVRGSRGLKVHAYTKVPDMVRVCGYTGIMLNMSLIPTKTGFKEGVDSSKLTVADLDFDNVEGMEYNIMRELRDQFPETAGNIMIGISDDHIRLLMESDDIDFIIPYHVSKLDAQLAEIMGIRKWKDYTKYQEPKPMEGYTKAKEPALKDWFNIKEARKFEAKGDKLKEQAKKLREQGKEKEAADLEAEAEKYNGYAYMREASKKYLDLCYKNHTIPPFTMFLKENNGKYELESEDSNYWKVLVDRKMVNHKTGKVIEQKKVKPIFDRNALLDVLNRGVDSVAHSNAEKAANELISKILSGETEITPGLSDAVKRYTDSLDEAVREYADGPMIAAVTKDNAVDDPQIKYQLRDTDYMKAVEDDNMKAAQKMVDEAAKKAGYTTPKLYHGTPHFGFTQFEDPNNEVPFIYTSTKREVSAHYAGDQNYAFARPIGRKYRTGDSAEDIIENAKWVEGLDLHVMSPEEKEKEYEKTRKELERIGDKMEELLQAVDDVDWSDEMQNAESMVRSVFYEGMSVDEQYNFKEDDGYREQWRKDFKWSLDAFRNNINIVRDYVSDNYEKFKGAEKEYLDYITSYEFIDAGFNAVGMYLAATDDDVLTDGRGDMYRPANLKERMDFSHNIGAYELYGNLGDKPFEFDANGANFWGLKVPEIGDGYYGTDTVSKWAYDNGYTSVIMRNIYDYGDKADNYVFFNSSQVKSADPVTYDDNGNVIPLSKRFSDSADIRYQLRNYEIAERDEFAEAMETYAKTPVEKRVLNEYRRRLNEYIRRRLYRDSVYDQLSATKQESEKKRLNKSLLDAEKEIREMDAALFRMESNSQPVKDLLAKQTKEIVKGVKVVERAVREQKVQDEIDKRRAQMARFRENVHDKESKTKLRTHIKKKVKRLDDMLRHATNTRHIPDSLHNAVIQFCEVFTDNTSIFTKTQLDDIRAAYEMMKEGGRLDDIQLAGQYDENIPEMLNELRETMVGKRLSELTVSELETVKNVIDHLNHIVNNENTIFFEGKRQQVSELAKEAILEAQKDGPKKYLFKSGFAKFVGIQNLTPVTFFDNVGPVFKGLFNEMMAAQNDWGRQMEETSKYFEKIAAKYHYYDWSEHTKKREKRKHYDMTTERGEEISLTIEEALGLYATWQREKRDETQKASHLSNGGFVKQDAVKEKRLKGIVTYKVDVKDAHPLTQKDMTHIANKILTDDQKAYADELVRYMSEDMAALGNEASQMMHGYSKFKVKYYYPYKSSDMYLKTKLDSPENTPMIKSVGFSKNLTPNANNPVVARDFTDVFTEHVTQMIYYRYMAPAQDNFMRVYNYQTPPEAGSKRVAVKAEISTGYGQNANDYILQFMRDIYGGTKMDLTAATMDKAISLFKQNAVMMSASVVIQQPTSLLRAFAMINPKYFAGVGFSKKAYDEMYKHSGIAVIKSMGRFDIYTSRSTSSWLTKRKYDGFEKAKGAMSDADYRNDLMARAPQKADEMAWTMLWNAVKKETLAKTDLKKDSDEFFAHVTKRFNDIVNHTQVYDSVFVRSQNMRSKDPLMKMMTAFMSEPTVYLNMAYNGLKQGHAFKVAGVLLFAIVLNDLAKSLVYAGRDSGDDDDDKTYIEKYIAEVVGNFKEDINPVTYIPFLKDIWSVWQGYDIERSDMSIVTDIRDRLKIAIDSDASLSDRISALAESIGIITGVPVKNVMRDIDTTINIIFRMPLIEETTPDGVKLAILEELQKDKLIGRFFTFTGDDTYDKMSQALIEGDMETYNKMREKAEWFIQAQNESDAEFTADDADKQITNAVKNQIKESYLGGEIKTDRAEALLKKVGVDENDAYFEVEKWEYESTHDDEYSKYGKLRDAVRAGKGIEDAKKELMSHGVKEENIDKQISEEANNIMKEEYYPAFDKAIADKDVQRYYEERQKMGNYRQKITGQSDKDIDSWLKSCTTKGIRMAYESGKISYSDAVSMLQGLNGYSYRSASGYVSDW